MVKKLLCINIYIYYTDLWKIVHNKAIIWFVPTCNNWNIEMISVFQLIKDKKAGK